jgi:hypothetical protein
MDIDQRDMVAEIVDGFFEYSLVKVGALLDWDWMLH